jgi:hypothetical protein
MDPHGMIRLVERTVVGDGSPGPREAEGEGGEGFYIAQSSRRADLRVSPGGGRGLDSAAEEIRAG